MWYVFNIAKGFCDKDTFGDDIKFTSEFEAIRHGNAYIGVGKFKPLFIQ